MKNAGGYRPMIGGGGQNGGTMRDLRQLKSVTRCKSYGELGHRHKERPPKNASQEKIPQGLTGATASGTSRGWRSLVEVVDDFETSHAADSSSTLQIHHEEETCPIDAWNPEELVNNFSRPMGFENFSPEMLRAIRHVRRVFPGGFAPFNRGAQPLESGYHSGNAAKMEPPMQQVEFPLLHRTCICSDRM